MYQARRKASEAQSSATSFEDYLAGLEQKLLIEEVSIATLPRIAQMHQKTNQFNLTTRRYDEADIKTMMESDNHMVVLGTASDKFGDHGISICATIAIEDEKAELTTLLMSCRVIGREVEVAFLGAYCWQSSRKTALKPSKPPISPQKKTSLSPISSKSKG